VSYEHDSLPGFLFRPDSSGAKRPTVVMTNGSEGSKSGLWAWGVSSTLARGWNAFDELTARGDVDGSALFAYGCSQAGYWVTRALAFEHRFLAAVVDPGVMNVSASWLSNIPPALAELLKAGKKDEFNAAMAMAARNPKMAEVIAARGRPFAKPTVYDTFKAAMEYNVQEVIGQVKTPLQITDPDEEAFWPGQSKEVYARLTGEREVAHYSREDGANWHCEPMGRLEVELKMLDYFQDHLLERQ